MKHGFWSTLPHPFFVLAPMADGTDVPFRTVIARCGRPDVFYTEFVSAAGLASPEGRPKLLRDLVLTDTDHPIVAQFFGTEPEHLHAAAVLAREMGFDGVDVNMGCPDRSIVKQGAGIALAKDPPRAKEIISALREGAGSLPVSVKTRLGLYDTGDMDAWVGALLDAKPVVLIVHGRTMKEMSNMPAHWDLIGRTVEMAHGADVLCVGNGDVMTRQQGIELAERWNVDGIMIGRGIFRDPWLFGPHADETHTPQERLSLLSGHLDLWEKQWGTIKSFSLMKRFMKVYVSGWDGAKDLRARLMEAPDIATVRCLIETKTPVSS